MKTKISVAAIVMIAFLGFSNSTFAQTHFAQTHPRRAEVNSRLANQNKRIDNKVAEGKMSKGEAAKLHRNDHAIRQEERDMSKQNGSHITPQEKKTLNQQENANSTKITNH